MRTKVTRWVAAIVGIGLTSVAFGGGWGSTVTITGYYVYSSSTAYINTSNNQNLDNCSSSHYLALDPTQANFKELWATVMTAQATGQTVTLSYAGCSAGGLYPLINAVALPKVW